MNRILTLAIACFAGVSFAAEKKRVVVCTVTTGFRHSSIPFAEKTIEKLGAESGLYEVVGWSRQPEVNVPKKPEKPKAPKPLDANADDKAKAKFADETKKFEQAVAKYAADMAKWGPEQEAAVKDAQTKRDEAMKASMAILSPDALKANKVDLVIFANTTGDLPLPDRDGFIKWVADGGNFAGMHSAGDTFHGFKGYLDMIQAEFKTHGAQVPADLVAGDKAHPSNAGIGEAWNVSLEEMYEFKDGSHDREKIRALWYLKHHPQRKDEAGYNPVSWCRMLGKGHVFYTSLGHREDLWSDDPAMPGRKNSVETSKQYQAHILGGIKWALGLAKGDATPNPELK
jgi:type 1 glutamine amidotransferase